MSKKQILIPALIVSAFLMFIPACGDCEDKDCGTYGTCFGGVCFCGKGYEDSTSGYCDVEWCAKFLGTYYGTDDCRGTLTKPVKITRRNKSLIRISNFGGFDSYIEADITDSSGVANVFEMNYTDPVGRVFTGNGTLTDNSIESHYTMVYLDTIENCVFNITK